MLTPSSKHSLHNLLGYRLRIEGIVDERIAFFEALEQCRPGVALAYQYRPYLGRVVYRRELSAQTLVECEGGRLRRSVVDHARSSDIGSDTGNGNHHAVVFGNHIREELLNEKIMADGINEERKFDVCFCAVEDRLAASNTCIVDEDGRITEGALNGIACSYDFRSGCKIAFEVMDCWGTWFYRFSTGAL